MLARHLLIFPKDIIFHTSSLQKFLSSGVLLYFIPAASLVSKPLPPVKAVIGSIHRGRWMLMGWVELRGLIKEWTTPESIHFVPSAPDGLSVFKDAEPMPSYPKQQSHRKALDILCSAQNQLCPAVPIEARLQKGGADADGFPTSSRSGAVFKQVLL